jgi:pyruvate/2-oxoglutarate dehydrogenase complex dihydrolipoamide dehydrogenase (E3) component
LAPRWPGVTSWYRTIPTQARSGGYRARVSISCAARDGWLGFGVVEVNGVRHTATHVVLATGPGPVVPPTAGLPELADVWTNREATGMKTVPKRLVVLGGGPVGVEIAQAARRLGGEVVLVEGAKQLLAREPAPLGQALGEVLRRGGVELLLGVRATSVRMEGGEYLFEV